MQAQKQIHASQLWQQGLNDVILKSCDTIVSKTLLLVVQCKAFSLMSSQARNYQYEKVCLFDRNLLDLALRNWALFMKRLSLIRIFQYIDKIVSVFWLIWTVRKIWIRFCWHTWKYGSEKVRSSAYFT